MLPMLALLDLFDELRTNEFRATGDLAFSLSAQIYAFHQVVGSARHWVVEGAVELRWTDQLGKLISGRRAAMNYGHREDAGSFEDRQARCQIKELGFLLVVDVEFEKEVQ